MIYQNQNDRSNPIQPEELLRREDVARILNISRSFAYLLMKRGEFPIVRMGRSVRVRPSDLEQYIEKNTSIRAHNQESLNH